MVQLASWAVTLHLHWTAVCSEESCQGNTLDHSCCFLKISVTTLFFFFEVLGIEPRTLHMRSKCSTTNHPLQSWLFYFPDMRQHFSFGYRLVLNSEIMRIDTFKLLPRTTWLVQGLNYSWADHGFQNILPSLGPHQGLLVLQLSEGAFLVWTRAAGGWLSRAFSPRPHTLR